MRPLHELDRERWLQARRVAGEAREAGDPAAAARSLCGGDAELLAAVQELLADRPDPEAGGPDFRELVDEVAGSIDLPAEGVETSPAGLAAHLRIERLAGRGGMGAVFEAVDTALGRRVAVKLMNEATVLDAHLAERFELEARALASLSHPGIVEIYEHGLAAPQPYIVLEWVPGATLGDWLDHARRVGGLSASSLHGRDVADFLAGELGEVAPEAHWTRPYWELAAHVCARLARALEAAHQADVVHRDVKPANVLLRADGEPALTDFGLAAMCGEASLASRSGALGSPGYMAPEQLQRGEARLGPWVDVYGLGATLYSLITLRPPFEGSLPEVLAQTAASLPKAPRKLVPEVPRELEAICLRALEKRPQDRYPSAAAMAEDLEAFLERRPVSARPPSVLGRVTRWCHRRPTLATALVLAALVVLLLGREAGTSWAAERRSERELRERSLRARLPALLALEHYPARPLDEPYVEPKEELEPVIDELVDLRPANPHLRFYRGLLRSRWNELEGAEADFEHLRAEPSRDTPVLRELAEVVLADDPTERWDVPHPSRLPESTGAWDDFLIGYTALRWKDAQRAWTHLDRAVRLDPGVESRELRVLAGLNTGRTDFALEEVRALERGLGETPRTCHFQAAAMLQLRQLDGCEAKLHRALELVPDQHGPLHNLGVLYQWQGKAEQAEEYLRRSLEIRPMANHTRLVLAGFLTDAGEFEQARVLLEEARARSAKSREQLVRMTQLNLHLRWARSLRTAGEGARAEQTIAVAREIADELSTAAAKKPFGRDRWKIELNVALVDAFGAEDADETLDALWSATAGILADRQELSGAQDALTNLGAAFEARGDADRAEVLYHLAHLGGRPSLFVVERLQRLKLDRVEALLDQGAPLDALDVLADPTAHSHTDRARSQSLTRRTLDMLPGDMGSTWESFLAKQGYDPDEPSAPAADDE